MAGGGSHSLAIKTNGSIVAWGKNAYGQCSVPAPNSGFIAVAGGYEHSVGLKANGSIVAWGYNGWGQCDVPPPNQGFVAIAAGYYHTLGLKSDGTIVAWGDRTFSQCPPPEPNTNYIAISAAYASSICLRAAAPSAVHDRPLPRSGQPPALRILSVAPNPFSAVMELMFHTPETAGLRLEVCTVEGRAVTSWPLGLLEPGIHHVWWDGRNGSGHPVASGVYFVRLVGAGEGSSAVRVVLLR
jgi:hypothetical protein